MFPRGCDSTADEIGYILGHAECEISFAENVSQAEKILSKAEDLPCFKENKFFLIQTAQKNSGKTKEIEILSFDDIVKIGTEAYGQNPEFFEKEVEIGSCEDMATIIYTSGTTGNHERRNADT